MPKAKEKQLRLAKTPEGREAQLVGMAEKEAARRIMNGTASSQLLTHFLKLGTEREKLERERIRQQNRLDEAKILQIESEEKAEKKYQEAVNAMKKYSGYYEEDIDDDY